MALRYSKMAPIWDKVHRYSIVYKRYRLHYVTFVSDYVDVQQPIIKYRCRNKDSGQVHLSSPTI